MLVYEYKLDGSKRQEARIEEAIRTAQFIRNKCLRLWMDNPGTSKNNLQTTCRVLAQEYPFARRLNSMARQASADRAWFAISRFYDACCNSLNGTEGHSGTSGRVPQNASGDLTSAVSSKRRSGKSGR